MIGSTHGERQTRVCVACRMCLAGDHEAGEVGRGAYGDAHADFADVLGEDSERVHPGLFVFALGRSFLLRQRTVERRQAFPPAKAIETLSRGGNQKSPRYVSVSSCSTA